MSCAICCWRSRHDALTVVKAFLTGLERWLLAVIAAARASYNSADLIVAGVETFEPGRAHGAQPETRQKEQSPERFGDGGFTYSGCA